MIYLLEYDRKQGIIRTLKPFEACQRAQAQRERLDMELALSRSYLLEVVLLEAADEQTLRRTHQRYFKSPQELVQSIIRPADPVCP